MKISTEEYEDACCQVAGAFQTIVSYLQQDLSRRAFNVADEEFPALKIKHNYLAELASTIKNVSTTKEIQQ